MTEHLYRSRRTAPARAIALPITLVCTLAVLLPYAPRLDAGGQLPDALFGIGLWGVALAALVARWRLGLGVLTAALAAGAGVPAAVICKVAWDVVRDPTSHNLWPFEVAIALAVGAVPAIPGALAGWGLSRLFPAGGR